MNQNTLRTLALAAGALLAGAAAQAQNVIVINSPDAAATRAAFQASVDAARRGESVGMLTGRANPQPQRLPGGAVGQELDASTLMFSVARIGADGRVERVCINSAQEAERAVHAPAFAQRFTPRAQEQAYVSK